MQGWQGLSDTHAQLSLLLSFPRCGNGWSKPLDSGLRRNDDGVASGLCRNDGGDCGQTFVRHGQGAVGMTTNPFSPPSSFQRKLAYRM